MTARLLAILSLLTALLAPASGAAPLMGVICGADGPFVVALPGGPEPGDAAAGAHQHCALCAALAGAPEPGGAAGPTLRTRAALPMPRPSPDGRDAPRPRARAPPLALSA
jgi:hypothetical protein